MTILLPLEMDLCLLLTLALSIGVGLVGTAVSSRGTSLQQIDALDRAPAYRAGFACSQ
jgi:hypothetical protein